MSLNAPPMHWRVDRNRAAILAPTQRPGFSRFGPAPQRITTLFGQLEGHGPAPFICQRELGLFLDATNCGPSCMAMVGKAFGAIPQDVPDSEAVERLGRLGHTTDSGTRAYGLAVMADALGLDFEQRLGVAAHQVAQQLRSGALVIVLGNAFKLPWSYDPAKTSPHVVLVTGVDEGGNFLVNDPEDRQHCTRPLSPAALESFGSKGSREERPCTMAVGKLRGPRCCRQVLPGELPLPGMSLQAA